MHSAEDCDELLLPEIERQQAAGKQVAFRGDPAFAKPEIYEALEERGADYAIRIPANKNLELEIEDILFRPPGRSGRKPLVRYKSFLYRAASWKQGREGSWPRWSITPGELFRTGQLHRHQPELCQAGRWCVSTTSAARRSSGSKKVSKRRTGRGCRAIASGRTRCACS